LVPDALFTVDACVFPFSLFLTTMVLFSSRGAGSTSGSISAAPIAGAGSTFTGDASICGVCVTAVSGLLLQATIDTIKHNVRNLIFIVYFLGLMMKDWKLQLYQQKVLCHEKGFNNSVDMLRLA
jgi:hypothetical protein